MAEIGRHRNQARCRLGICPEHSQKSSYDPELVTSKGGELVKSKLVKSEIGKNGLVMSGEKDHPTATPPTRTSIPPSPAPTSEAVNGQFVRNRTRTHSQVVKDRDEDGFELVKSRRAKKETKKVSSLGIRMPDGLKSMEEAPELEVLEMAVDSGASESVVSDEMITSVETVEGDAMRKRVRYEVTDGTLIPHLG